MNLLRTAFRMVKTNHPFTINATVILPEHLHCVWTLPPGDSDYATRWSLIKTSFSRALPNTERESESRKRRRERGIWQRRFWEHIIRDEEDYRRHVETIHWNPVKHGWVKRVVDWPHSSFHSFVRRGVYSIDWGYESGFDLNAGE